MTGFNLPPGCSVMDIERAYGGDGSERCMNPECRRELDEENDPQGCGVCSPECVWPAIAATEQERREQRAADEAEARWLKEMDALQPEIERLYWEAR